MRCEKNQKTKTKKNKNKKNKKNKKFGALFFLGGVLLALCSTSCESV